MTKQEMKKAIEKATVKAFEDLQAFYNECLKNYNADFSDVRKGQIYRLLVPNLVDGIATDTMTTCNDGLRYVFATHNKKGVEPYGIQIKAVDDEEVTLYFIYAEKGENGEIEYKREKKSVTVYREDYGANNNTLYADEKDLKKPTHYAIINAIVPDKVIADGQKAVDKAYTKAVAKIKADYAKAKAAAKIEAKAAAKSTPSKATDKKDKPKDKKTDKKEKDKPEKQTSKTVKKGGKN